MLHSASEQNHFMHPKSIKFNLYWDINMQLLQMLHNILICVLPQAFLGKKNAYTTLTRMFALMA